ncbi:MAG: SMP-30/gluconolactonase/LRE family protein, partial [Bacteroidetes bacterium]
MNLTPAPLFSTITEHGEGPIWDPATQRYYWVDLLKGQYFEGNPENGQVDTHELGQALGVMALRRQGGIVAALQDGFACYDPETRALRRIETPPLKAQLSNAQRIKSAFGLIPCPHTASEKASL